MRRHHAPAHSPTSTLAGHGNGAHDGAQDGAQDGVSLTYGDVALGSDVASALAFGASTTGASTTAVCDARLAQLRWLEQAEGTSPPKVRDAVPSAQAMARLSEPSAPLTLDVVGTALSVKRGGGAEAIAPQRNLSFHDV